MSSKENVNSFIAQELENFAVLKDKQCTLLQKRDAIYSDLMRVKEKEAKMDPSLIPEANQIHDILWKHGEILGTSSSVLPEYARIRTTLQKEVKNELQQLIDSFLRNSPKFQEYLKFRNDWEQYLENTQKELQSMNNRTLYLLNKVTTPPRAKRGRNSK